MDKKELAKIREELKKKKLEQLENFLLNRDEMESIRLIESIKDPNIEFENEKIGKLPIFLFDNKMFTALNYIIKMKNFDPNVYGAFGGTFVNDLMEIVYSDDIPLYKFNIFVGILENVLSLDNINPSLLSVNDDNLLNVACRVGAKKEIIERLIEIGVSPNNVNDIGYTAAGDAIRTNHFHTFDLLVEKFGINNLKFSENDLKLIQEFKDRFNIN